MHAQACKLNFSRGGWCRMGSYPRVLDKKGAHDLFGPVNKLYCTAYDRAMPSSSWPASRSEPHPFPCLSPLSGQAPEALALGRCLLQEGRPSEVSQVQETSG